MEIRIIEAIDDPFLQSEWIRLEQEGDVFPQNSYNWCSTWWKYLGGKRKLHVVMAMDEKGKVHGIAPLCIERHFGIPVLRSFPIHFGDFYSFITLNNTISQSAINCILEYLASNRLWRWVWLDQVSEKSNLVRSLEDYNYQKKRMTGCVIVDFADMTWDDYLSVLKTKYRSELRRRLKKASKSFTLHLKIIRDWGEYRDKFGEMLGIFHERWRNDYRPNKGRNEQICWQESIKGQFEKGKMIYYQLLFDNTLVAYSLGFLHQGVFFAWHASFNPKYRSYYPGILIHALMTKDLMGRNISYINFMAGEYGWKLDWSPDRKIEANYMFTSPPDNVSGFLLRCYYHNLRDKLKSVYHRIMKYGTLRAISRNVIRLRQKIVGMR
ncbi:MAG: GNAT family N-acetyltransferase [Anaerolineaceae bacterium]|nr:GNAT family N-acetyltransferase [Anaerolineaceae bacterium]